MLRAAERAARSAALCARPFPVTAPTIAASSSAVMISAAPAPSTAGRACPRSPSRSAGCEPSPSKRRAIRAALAELRPPEGTPARALRAASAVGAVVATCALRPRLASSLVPSAARERWRGSSTMRHPPTAPSRADSRAGTQSAPGTCTTTTSAPASARASPSSSIGSPSSPVSAKWHRCPRAEPRRPAARSTSSSRRAAGEASRVVERRRASGPSSASRVGAPPEAPTSAAMAAASARLERRSGPVTSRDEALLLIPLPRATGPMPQR